MIVIIKWLMFSFQPAKIKNIVQKSKNHTCRRPPACGGGRCGTAVPALFPQGRGRRQDRDRPGRPQE